MSRFTGRRQSRPEPAATPELLQVSDVKLAQSLQAGAVRPAQPDVLDEAPRYIIVQAAASPQHVVLSGPVELLSWSTVGAWARMEAMLWLIGEDDYELQLVKLNRDGHGPKEARVRWSQVESWSATDARRRLVVRSSAHAPFELRLRTERDYEQWRRAFVGMQMYRESA